MANSFYNKSVLALPLIFKLQLISLVIATTGPRGRRIPKDLRGQRNRYGQYARALVLFELWLVYVRH